MEPGRTLVALKKHTAKERHNSWEVTREPGEQSDGERWGCTNLSPGVKSVYKKPQGLT